MWGSLLSSGVLMLKLKIDLDKRSYFPLDYCLYGCLTEL